MERTYTIEEIKDYFKGYECAETHSVAWPNGCKLLSKGALHNAWLMLEDDQDGIEAVQERKEYYKNLKQDNDN